MVLAVQAGEFERLYLYHAYTMPHVYEPRDLQQVIRLTFMSRPIVNARPI